MNLLALALETLTDTTNPHGLRDAACACLVAALEEGLAVPPKTPAAMWNWVRSTTPKRWDAAQYRLGQMFDQNVFESALEAARDPASGVELRGVAMDVLSGAAYAPLITDEMLADLVDRAHVEADRLAILIQNVHRARRVPVKLLLGIRDRWSTSSAEVREASVAIAALIAKPDNEFWTRMIDDPHEDVRIAVVQALAKVARTEFATNLIKGRLECEDNIDVRSELHSAMSVLVHREDDQGHR